MRATCRRSSRARSRCSTCSRSSGDSADSAAGKGACVAHAAAHLSTQLSARGEGCDGASAAVGMGAPLCGTEAAALLGRCWAAAPSRGAGRCHRLAFDGWTRGVEWAEAWWAGRLADPGLDHRFAAAELVEADLGLRLLALAELGRFWKGVSCGAGVGARR